MAEEEFEDQGRLATMDPSPLARMVTSMLLRYVVSERRERSRRERLERGRQRAGRAHVVTYFHQVDDGYSHLAAQLLRPLFETYEIELVCRLVSPPSGRNAPEPELLAQLSHADAAKVAPHYGLAFPEGPPPNAADVQTATRILAAALNDEFPDLAPRVGDALWRGASDELAVLARERRSASDGTVAKALATGDAERERLGHYSGAMFHYEGEWYWGVDRVYHLEQRLIALGARRRPGEAEQLLAPRPSVATGPLRDDGSLTLEIYPSVRSPYTSIEFDAAVHLAEATGVRLVVRPVLPMVMRNVALTRQKGVYIFIDAAREARAQGQERWGNVYDPIGEPVRRCYALYPWAERQGRGVALLSAFLRAAFFDGVNTNRRAGLRRVVKAAGLDWAEAKGRLGDTAWQDEIEANRQAMYRHGLWGVPSFHLRDATGATALAAWGQDRLWLVSREIQRLLGAPAVSETAP